MKRVIYLLVTCNLMERTLNIAHYDMISTARDKMNKAHKTERTDLNNVVYDKNMRTVTYDNHLNCVMISRIEKMEL